MLEDFQAGLYGGYSGAFFDHPLNSLGIGEIVFKSRPVEFKKDFKHKRRFGELPLRNSGTESAETLRILVNNNFLLGQRLTGNLNDNVALNVSGTGQNHAVPYLLAGEKSRSPTVDFPALNDHLAAAAYAVSAADAVNDYSGLAGSFKQTNPAFNLYLLIERQKNYVVRRHLKLETRNLEFGFYLVALMKALSLGPNSSIISLYFAISELTEITLRRIALRSHALVSSNEPLE
ncbi:MAG: hypothetical protein L6437_02795 [Kiritimatiellae bacterium]|nr:hypothetical protein [Kiritimatiellia bacterium]